MNLDWFIQPNIRKFDGTNFKQWKIAIRRFLESQDYLDVVENKNYENEYSKEEFKKRSKKVLSYIFQAVNLSIHWKNFKGKEST